MLHDLLGQDTRYFCETLLHHVIHECPIDLGNLFLVLVAMPQNKASVAHLSDAALLKRCTTAQLPARGKIGLDISLNAERRELPL